MQRNVWDFKKIIGFIGRAIGLLVRSNAMKYVSMGNQ